jgi:hypothetical protein
MTCILIRSRKPRGQSASTDVICTTKWIAGAAPGFTDVHEHVTLETPRIGSETQRLRLMTAKEAGITWKT